MVAGTDAGVAKLGDGFLIHLQLLVSQAEGVLRGGELGVEHEGLPGLVDRALKIASHKKIPRYFHADDEREGI